MAHRITAKRELLHEWMHRFEIAVGFRVVRVWTQADPACVMAEFYTQHDELKGYVDRGDISGIATLAYVNAVEQLDRSGNGRLVYIDWP